MNSQRLARILRRTPGEVAFDRCFFPLAALAIVGVIAERLTTVLSGLSRSHAGAQPSSDLPEPTWFLWVSFAIGLVIAFLWLRATVSVVRGWRDPSSRVLRFSSLGLLVPLAWIAVRLLLSPFSK